MKMHFLSFVLKRNNDYSYTNTEFNSEFHRRHSTGEKLAQISMYTFNIQAFNSFSIDFHHLMQEGLCCLLVFYFLFAFGKCNNTDTEH